MRALLTSPTSLRVEVTSRRATLCSGRSSPTTTPWSSEAPPCSPPATQPAPPRPQQSTPRSPGWSIPTTAAGTANDIGQKLIRGQITNGTTITFDRSSTGQTLDVAWELVEFTDATSVQHASAAFAAGQTLRDVTISTVDATVPSPSAAQR